MSNSLHAICKKLLKVTPEEFSELEALAQEQIEYFSPLKMATTTRQHRLGEYNKLVVGKLRDLQTMLKSGADI